MDHQVNQEIPTTEDEYKDTHDEHLVAYFEGVGAQLQSGEITLKQFAHRMADTHKEMEKKVFQDGLVPEFLNNIGFTNQLEELIELSKRVGFTITFLALDIDLLKQFNDRMGHIAGDRLIKAYARVISAHVRESDVKGRLGGDEFAVLLPNATAEDGEVIAERIREGVIEEVKKEFPDLPWDQSISIGIAQAIKDDDAESLRIKADNALYEAKKEKNKVVTAKPEATK